jgi:hypothetical protein
MSNTLKKNGSESKAVPAWALASDVWAVTLALFLSLLVWSGVITRVPW